MNTDINNPGEPQTTGRYIVTFRDGASSDGLAAMKKRAGLGKGKLMTSSDFGKDGMNIEQLAGSHGMVFEHLGIAVVSVDPNAAGAMAQEAGDDSAILAVEPEGIMYALSELPGSVPLDYLRGFRDAADTLYNQARTVQGGADSIEAEIAAAFTDNAQFTWGLKATKASGSRYSGRGIKVAILDTGLVLDHPDFVGRPIVSKSFIAGAPTVQDGHGHGTHCTGTACGPRQPGTGRRYGVAYLSDIHIGKVLSDQGSGGDVGILAGIDWAVATGCQVISMSLGANVPTTTVAYETAGQRALDAGTLIVAAGGNNGDRSAGNFGFVCRPANSRSFMAVAAVDSRLRIANFSARDTVHAEGSAVDIAGPGVAVYSSWLMPARYNTISGTSMATPHVAGVAALWAQKTGTRGASLWQRLITSARTMTQPTIDVGRGLVQAP